MVGTNNAAYGSWYQPPLYGHPPIKSQMIAAGYAYYIQGCNKYVAVAALLIVIYFGTYLRLATTVIGDFVSPDGMHDAVLMVRNGWAADGYSTGVSLVRAHNPLARQIALLKSGDLFVIDDNDGAVRWGDRGQLDVKIKWVSNTQLIIQYPARARVFKQETSCQSTTVRYVPL